MERKDRKKAATELADPKTAKALMESFATDDMHAHRVDRNSFTIFVGGDPAHDGYDHEGIEPGVEYRMADRFDINMSLLSRINSKRPILVQMSSCGGHWDEGMQMFGSILASPNPVTVMATKWARSMTSIIPLAADKFVIRPPAQYMIHHGTYGYEGGAGEEAETAWEELKKARECMLQIYVARLRAQGKFKMWTDEKIYTMLEDRMRRKVDVWLSGDEAVEWGFIDNVFEGDWNDLRAKEHNVERRKQMMNVVRKF